MRPIRRALAATAAVVLIGCSTATEPTRIPLTPGLYTFTTTIDEAWCTATGQRPSHALSLPSVPELVGPDWLFRVLDQPDATFEFRIAGIATGTTWQVNGYIRGSAIASAPPSVTADFGKLGVVTGTADSQQASGLINGQVRFVGGQGNALTCTRVHWSFARAGTQ